MPAPLSIVVPTLNAARHLQQTLASLVPGLQINLIRELVVVDGGSGDATRQIAEDAGAVIVSAEPGRGQQIASGVAAAKGDWVLILHADTELSPEWADVALNHISRGQGAAYFRLQFRASGFWPGFIAGGANLRSTLLGLPYGDQGLLISRDLLARIGGVPDVPLMEDVILARRLKGNLTPLAAIATTSAERYQREGWLRRALRNLSLLARFLAGVSPERLAEGYRGRPKSR